MKAGQTALLLLKIMRDYNYVIQLQNQENEFLDRIKPGRQDLAAFRSALSPTPG